MFISNICRTNPVFSLVLGATLLGLVFSALAQVSTLDLDAINRHSPTNDIITAGQPSERDIATLKKAGVTTVINMRAEGEHNDFDEQALVEANGMRYIHIPVAGAKGMTQENAEKLDAALAESKGKIFAHCASGNRAGGLFALRAFYLQDKQADEAIDIGKAAGLTSLKPVVAAKMKLENNR